MATEYVTRSEFDALRGEFDQFVRLFESNTSAGNAVRAERKVAERKARPGRRFLPRVTRFHGHIHGFYRAGYVPINFA